MSLRRKADQLEKLLIKKGIGKDRIKKLDFSHWTTDQLRAFTHWTPGIPYSDDIKALLKEMGIDESIQ